MVEKIALADQIAGIVHDVKNRLQLLSPRVSSLCENEQPEVRENGQAIHLALNKIDHQLVLLLGIYRLEEASLFSQQECYVADILAAVGERVSERECLIECEEDLTVFGDARLITAVLGDALHNAVTHSSGSIGMSATRQGRGVLIRIEDDGLLDSTDAALSLNSSATVDPDTAGGLGMLLAEKVATAHRNGEETGYVRLCDAVQRKGACFELYLP